MDRRAEDHGSKPNNRRPFQRLRSPSRYTRLYRPRFEAKHFRSRFRFFRTMEERNFHRPNFAQRYQRYHRGHWSSLQLSRKPRSTSPSRQRLNKGLDKSSFKAIRQQTTDIPCPSSGERPSLPLTVSQKSNKRDAAARNRAIQKKQEQIEEELILEEISSVAKLQRAMILLLETKVYRQDCDTFGMVVKMLVTKDPSLEESIQPSLRENLRDIGLRCIQAMEHFIQEYDSQKMDNTSNSQLHSSQ